MGKVFRTGCLLMAENENSLPSLRRALARQDIFVRCLLSSENMLDCARQCLNELAGKSESVCIVSLGRWWVVALALSAQLRVDRLALLEIDATCIGETHVDDRQYCRLRGFVRRNLFFCVSDVLVLGRNPSMEKEVFSRMVNARVHIFPSDGGNHKDGFDRWNLTSDFLTGYWDHNRESNQTYCAQDK